ncbi:MAG: amidohydrolase family protein [Pseudolabrys sp.]|jgi:aminocarboxymuconate-semialdehyde decarboxylase
MPVIDMHTHALSRRVNPLIADVFDPKSNPYIRDMSAESAATDADQGKIVPERMLNLVERRDTMARMGVDIQVIAPAPAQQHYWADEERQVALSRVQNEDMAALVAQDPARFVAMGTLPMRFPKKAIEEAVHAVESLGLRAFQIDSRVESLELSDPAFDPLYKRLAELRAPLFIHPLGFSHGQRLGAFFMINTVGQPLEETIAASHFIMGGVLDRHPDLDIIIAHGGGFFPHYIGRFDHAWKARPEVHKLCPRPPSAYLKRFWYDTCVFDPVLVARLVDTVGAERVMLGSDYPFDMGDPDPVGTFDKAGIAGADRDRIVYGNAAWLFRIG